MSAAANSRGDIALMVRLEFYAAMVRANIFTAGALAAGFVLLYRHMNSRTGRCDPAIETLAAETGLEPRSVKRAIRELEQSGWWHVNKGTGRGHTNSYRPDFTKGDGGDTLLTGEKVSTTSLFMPEKGDSNGQKRVTGESPEPGKNQEEDSPLPPKVDKRACDFRFAEFWQVYPSRGEYLDGEEPARRSFEAAVARGADPEEIIDGAQRYAAHAAKTGMEPRYVVRAERWLKEQRWTDRVRPVAAPRVRVSGGLF